MLLLLDYEINYRTSIFRARKRVKFYLHLVAIPHMFDLSPSGRTFRVRVRPCMPHEHKNRCKQNLFQGDGLPGNLVSRFAEKLEV